VKRASSDQPIAGGKPTSRYLSHVLIWITSGLPTTRPELVFSPLHTASLDSGLQSAGTVCHWLSAQNLVSIFGRAGSAHMPEHSRKVLLRFEAAGHGDIQDARARRAQHLLRPLDSVA
jgi:hypothetical protein